MPVIKIAADEPSFVLKCNASLSTPLLSLMLLPIISPLALLLLTATRINLCITLLRPLNTPHRDVHFRRDGKPKRLSNFS